MPSSSNPTLRELIARRGIDPNAPVVDEPPFDPIAWRLEHYRALLAAEIPEEFATALPKDPAVLAWLEQHRADPSAFPSLMLSGNLGVGKTMHAYGCLRVLAGHAARANRDFRWKFATYSEMNADMRPKPDGSNAYALDPLLEVEFLILDDVGAGKASDFTVENITRLVDHRWANRLATIYTTNLDVDALEAAVGARVVSRLGTATLVELGGPDRRFGGDA